MDARTWRSAQPLAAGLVIIGGDLLPLIIEEAHLGRLIAKIGEPGRSPLERLVFTRPAPIAPDAAASNPKSNI